MGATGSGWDGANQAELTSNPKKDLKVWFKRQFELARRSARAKVA